MRWWCPQYEHYFSVFSAQQQNYVTRQDNIIIVMAQKNLIINGLPYCRLKTK